MKRLFSLLLLTGLVSTGMAQLKAKVICPDFYVDVLDGTVNGLKPSNTQNEIKEKFPCFTSAEAESQEAKCGGGICGVIVSLREPIDPATGRPQVDNKNPNPALKSRPIVERSRSST